MAVNLAIAATDIAYAISVANDTSGHVRTVVIQARTMARRAFSAYTVRAVAVRISLAVAEMTVPGAVAERVASFFAPV